MKFELLTKDPKTRARRGRLHTAHGVIETPIFMPVGTQATVKSMTPDQLKELNVEILLCNSYHLFLRPGPQTVAQLGGLHRFMAWDRPLLTDSGGFQVFSLAGFRRVSDDGVEFQSHLDGARRFLTPERAIEIQWTLGADVAMAFDHVVPGVADETTARDALERTLRWLERGGTRHRELVDSRLGGQAVSTNRLTAYPTIRQTLWPILQGGTHLDLRTEGLRRILELGV